MTARFKYLLSKRGLNQAGLAAAVHCGRCHLSQVLANVPGRGGQTRRKLAYWIVLQCGPDGPEMLKELGWDEEGNVLECSTGNVPDRGMLFSSGDGVGQQQLTN